LNTAVKLWQEMLVKLETSVSALNIDLWIKELEPLIVADTRLILCAPSVKSKEIVTNNLKGDIMEALKSISGAIDDVVIIDPVDRPIYVEDEPDAYVTEDYYSQGVAKKSTSQISVKYTFENFIVGKSNEYMHAGARGVAEMPGQQFNPLFIHGGSGLGKTHIMHAIGNAVAVMYPKLKVLYVSSEKFLNEFIESVRKNKPKQFREKYRTIDILMIDDIQFISGKSAMQEELFHTFNAMHGAEKQLIFTADRQPHEIRGLEDRLVTRLSGGLTVDVQVPDSELRAAILTSKALAHRVKIEPKVITFMAEKVFTNVRDLEGLLNRVVFLSRLRNSAPTLEMVAEAIKDVGVKSEEAVTADRVFDCVCRYFSISKDDLIGKKKTKEIVEVRHICMYLIGEIVGLPLMRVAECFGKKDHSTVIHARDKVLESMQSNIKTKLAVQDIKDMVHKK